MKMISIHKKWQSLLSDCPKGQIVAASLLVLPMTSATTQRAMAASTPGIHAVEQNEKTYQGVVIDAKTGEPIIGASILKAGGKSGTITDADGKFTLKAHAGEQLTISYISYKPKTVKLDKVTLLNIELVEEAASIDEVVVTAFGVKQKKESVVGAVTQVKGSDLKVPSANLSNSFAGRLAGVTAFQRRGEPGADGSDFYIRGISTFTATRPLIIIDGVEASSADLNALDSEVIESFSILKDATATAMYGTRGANGVMIVKTKGGENLDKAVINARVEGYVSMPTQIPQFANAETYMKMYNESVQNYGTGSKLYSDEFIEGVKSGKDPYMYPNVDWYHELFKDHTFNQKVNFNIRGGSKRVTYFVNANINHETGMLRGRSRDFYSYDNNIDIKRYTFQSNISLNITPTSTLTMNLGAELRDTHGPSVGSDVLFGAVMNNNPVDFPIFYPKESSVAKYGVGSEYIKWGAYNGGNVDGSYNPLAELTKGYSDSFGSTVRANVKYDQKLDFITKGLQFNALISFKNWAMTNIKRNRGYNKYELVNYTDQGYLLNVLGGTEVGTVLGTERTNTGDRSFYLQASINYDRTFNDLHNVSAMLLYNQDQYDAAYATEDLIATLPQRKMGIAGRLSYDYAHRYMAEINVGYNGSENFAKGHRFGFFPSLALGWNISEEKWFEPIKQTVHNFKLRGSYGLVGNASANTRFMYLPIVNLYGQGFTSGDGETNYGLNGPVFSRFANDKITWEVGYKANIGVDFGLFNCLNLTLELFNENRTNIFRRNLSVPNYMGTAAAEVWGNYAEINNKGFELTADFAKQINKDLFVQMRGSFSFARNKILKDAQAWHPDYPNKSNIGRPLNSISGYVYAGHLFMDEAEIKNSPNQQISGNVAPGDIKYVDIANKYGKTDGIINQYDMVFMGYPTVPEIIYGFGPSIKYKQWDFSVFFQGVAHTSLMMSGFHPFGSSINRGVLQFIAKDYWSVDNQNIYAKYPRLTKLDHANNTSASDYWLRNASFLKLKNAEIGYTHKFFRVYLSGTNLLTISSFKHWDPEMGGGNGLSYPTQRVINFGVQMNFK